MRIEIQPKGVVWEGPSGKTLLEILWEAGTPVHGTCGGQGTCGKCRVLVEGQPALACGVRPEEDLIVTVPGAEVYGGKETLSPLPAFFAPEHAHPAGSLGIAFDIGTTTLVGLLRELNSGALLAAVSAGNPQGVYGADVISRIAYAGKGSEELVRLQALICSELSDMAIRLFEKACPGAGAPHALAHCGAIREIALAGNSAMSHLFAGTDPASLARAPYALTHRGPRAGTAVGAGLCGFPGAEVASYYLMPCIAGHVGGDITAGILATDLGKNGKTELLIDIGTNGEIVLAKDGRLICCSTAAGPAFEGAGIHQGMRAAVGAIESVEIRKGEISLGVIGGGEPIGICGSGIIDAAAGMFSAGIIDETGRIQQGHRVREQETGREYVLCERKEAEDIVIRQKDLRCIQLAKAAISSGISLLMREAKVDTREISRIYIAGAFGSHVRPESARVLALAPEASGAEILRAGNTAGIGASMALLSGGCRRKAETIAETTHHLELTSIADFQEIYLSAIHF